jgi:hypothetical protein
MTTSQTPRPEIQDDEPPELELVIEAALRLRQILTDERPVADKRRAIDALGRALIRLKAALR